MALKKTLPFIPVPFMSVIPGRSPEQKVHKRLSDAKNAFDTAKFNGFHYTRPDDGETDYETNTHGWGQIYEFVDGEWQLHTDVPKPTADDIILDRETQWGPTYRAETRPWKLNK